MPPALFLNHSVDKALESPSCLPGSPRSERGMFGHGSGRGLGDLGSFSRPIAEELHVHGVLQHLPLLPQDGTVVTFSWGGSQMSPAVPCGG